MTCADVHETSASTELSQIEQDLRTLIEHLLHDMVLGYVDSLLYSTRYNDLLVKATYFIKESKRSGFLTTHDLGKETLVFTENVW